MGQEEPLFGQLGLNARTPIVRFDKQICVGSIGSFWSGRLLSGGEAGRPVLLRRIYKDEFTEAERATVLKAASAYGKLHHPSFVKTLGLVEQDGDLVTINEHLVGIPLLDLLRHCFDTASPLPANVALRIVLDAAQATAMAHRLSAEAGLFPSSRLFLAEGVFVASFGGTLLSEVGTLVSLAGCDYCRHIPDLVVQLAPEELDPTYVGSGSAEVFSLGVLLWQCLANHWLFEQDSESVARQELAVLPIPSLQTIERYGMPVPLALVELVQKATRRELEERYASLPDFIAAIMNLPSHFVATEHQVGEALRQRSRILVSLSLLDESTHATSGTFSEVPPSRTPTRPPAPDAFGSEPPTFAQSRLITAFPPLDSFDARVLEETVVEYITTEATSSDTQPATLVLARLPDQELIPSPWKKRRKLRSWVFYSVIALLLLGLAIVGTLRDRLFAPSPPPVKARLTETISDAPSPNLPNAKVGRQSLGRLPAENSLAKVAGTSARDASVTAPNQQNSPETSAAGSPLDESNQTPSQPTLPKKSKSVGPYRPKGI